MRTLTLAAVLAAGILSAPLASGGPGGCAAMGGAVSPEGVCQVQARDAAYALNVQFPLDYPDEQAIVDYLSQTRDGFVNVAQAPDARNLPYEMDVTADSFRSAQTRSVVLTLFQNVGSAHPTTWYKSFNYDLGRGRPLTFDTLFAADAKPLESIFPIVRRELESRTGLAVFPGDGMDPAHYQNFAVTDDAVTFYFGRAELLPSYAGATSVTVPRNQIPELQV